MVLHAGQDEVGLGQVGVLQQAAPEAGVEVRQQHLRGRKGRDGRDLDAVAAHLVQVVAQGQGRLWVGVDLEARVLMRLDRPPEAPSHVLAVQVDVAPGPGQFPDAGGHVPGR